LPTNEANPKAKSKAKGKGKGPESPAYAALREKLIRNFYQQPAIPKLLADQGYLSHQSGKWWEGEPKRAGFTHAMTRGFPNPGGRHGDEGLKIGREGMEPVFEFIDHATAEKKPFFLWYAPFMPHTPHTPPDRLFQKYKAKGIESDHVARYYAMVEWFDETCGQLMDKIEAKGLTEKQVLWKHVFRNALLPLVTGFPAAFIGAFFTGSLLIETLFSLDGLGLLAYESVMRRDYPVVFGTLYLFTLIGLFTKLISDLCYVYIDPRIQFGAGGGS
jgi:hypothetical protein